MGYVQSSALSHVPLDHPADHLAQLRSHFDGARRGDQNAVYGLAARDLHDGASRNTEMVQRIYQADRAASDEWSDARIDPNGSSEDRLQFADAGMAERAAVGLDDVAARQQGRRVFGAGR